MAKVKRRAKLSRAQTYAFGQSSSLQRTTENACPFDKHPASAVDSVAPRLPLISLGSSSSNFDAMDIDFSSPFRVSAIAQGHNKRHGLIFGVSRSEFR